MLSGAKNIHNYLGRIMKYDAIVVLGAVMEWDNKRKKWIFPTIIERYSGKLVMGHARAVAASLIADQSDLMLITGGSDTNPDSGLKESRAVELARLITGRYGVIESKVVAVGQLNGSHTQGNVENVVTYMLNNQNTSFKNIAILSPRFQVERAKLMFDANPFFSEQDITINWIIVEDVLVKRHVLYSRWFESVYNTQAARICDQMERQGISDLKAKKYNVKS